LSSRRERHQRDWILIQHSTNPEEEITVTGFLNFQENSKWITFTQIENEAGERICGHINLPFSKVNQLFSNLKENNHKQFIIKGLPSFYNNRGIKRGAINLNCISIKK